MGDEAPVLIAPVVTIEVLPGVPSLDGVSGVIFTSETAVAALAAEGAGRRAWCVGPRTAAVARAHGFDKRAAEGDAESLVAAILASGETGPLLHVRGREARGEVAARLSAAGIPCSEHVAYVQRTRPLDPAAQALLADDTPVLVALFSPNSATRLGEAAAGARAPLLVAAMSEAVAAAWTGPAPRALVVAELPEAGAMLDTLAALSRTP